MSIGLAFLVAEMEMLSLIRSPLYIKANLAANWKKNLNNFNIKNLLTKYTWAQI